MGKNMVVKVVVPKWDLRLGFIESEPIKILSDI